jgi:hypothetical protein
MGAAWTEFAEIAAVRAAAEQTIPRLVKKIRSFSTARLTRILVASSLAPRAAPISFISRYKYQDGLGYYESTRDTASHFFIDYLPKGVYVFEYSTRVVHKGEYQTGMAEIQCMYAPEFNSHSESFLLGVK